MKVLIAGSSPDAPRFFPGYNTRGYRTQNYVVSCTPPMEQGWLRSAMSKALNILRNQKSYAEMSEKEYAHCVLILLGK